MSEKEMGGEGEGEAPSRLEGSTLPQAGRLPSFSSIASLWLTCHDAPPYM